MLRLSNYVAGVMLLIGIADLPYVYYTFLRIVVFVISIYSAYQIKDTGKNVWILLYGGLAILFNPIIPIHLYDKEIWMVIDGLAGLFMFVSGFINSDNQSQEKTNQSSNKNSDRIRNRSKTRKNTSTQDESNRGKIAFCCNNCFTSLEANHKDANKNYVCPTCEQNLKVPEESAPLVGENIMRAVRSFSYISIRSFDEKLPEFWDKYSEEDWVLFSSASIIYCSIMLTKDDDLRVIRFENVLRHIKQAGEEEMVKAIKDFSSTWSEVKGGFDFKNHISLWLLTNLKGEEPSADEIQKYAKMLSNYVYKQAHSINNSFQSFFG